MQTLDAALVREFALSETARLQLRGEVFNALNRTNLGTPNRFVNTPQFASITGVVKDSSGAVLPGVTVEASSPVLIEKARSVITDASGQYRIVDLRPGSYAVTFSYESTRSCSGKR